MLTMKWRIEKTADAARLQPFALRATTGSDRAVPAENGELYYSNGKPEDLALTLALHSSEC